MDPSGLPVASAAVSLSCGLGKSLTAQTDLRGVFELAVPINNDCQLQVHLDGFEDWTIAVPPHQDVQVKAVLSLKENRLVMTVEEGATAVRDAAALSQTLDGRRLSELPANGRSLNRFALLDPQVRNTGGQGADGSLSTRLSINGGSFRTTSYQVDGGSNYEFSHANAPVQKFSVSAVAEFKTLTGQFGAEYGRSATGTLLATTRGGGDELHGEALYFLRPSGIQARPVAASRHTPNQMMQYGASLGGPLRPGRTHFFLNYEEMRQARGAFIQSPVASVYTGHFEDRMALARIDHRWTPNHSASLRLNGNREVNLNPNDRVSGFVQPSAATRNTAQAAGAQFTDRVVLASRTVNEFRLVYVDAIPSYSAPLNPAVTIVRPNYSTEGGSTYGYYKTRSLEAGDSFSLRLDGHFLRFGGDWLRQTVRDYSQSALGEYRFAPGPPRPSESPIQYTQTFGAGWIRQGQTLASGWAQDEWRLRDRLTATLGLRYEWQSVTHDANNWAPRAALAWNPDGRGRTTLRAAAGVFYDSYFFYLSRRMYLMGVHSPTFSLTIPAGAPGFPQFPNSLARPPAGAGSPRRDLYLDGAKRLNPYSLQYSFTVQQRLGRNWVFTMDALHSRTLKQFRVRDANAPAPFPRTQPGQLRLVAAADGTRPFSTWEGVSVRVVSMVENSSRSRFDGLVLRLSRHFAGRYTLEASYLANSATTYGMFFGEPNTGVPADWGNSENQEKGPSDFHQRHRLVTHSLVELPWNSQLSMVGVFASGLPVNPLTGLDNNGDTYLLDRPAGLGRNSFRTPPQVSADVSWSKRIRLREKATLELRVEAFNLLNHGNIIKPNAIFGDRQSPLPSFLMPVAGLAGNDPARQVQFGTKLNF